MGIISLEKANHLFWLGRYAERITGNVRIFMNYYDKMIDVDELVYLDFCSRLSIDGSKYKNSDDFANKFVYDLNDPDSLVSIINRVFDNAVTLRDEITGDSLAYIDLAKHLLEKEEHQTLMLELQQLIDYINAFWGSVYDTVSQNSSSIMKCGKHAERVELALRFDIKDDDYIRIKEKLKYRIKHISEKFDIRGLKELSEEFQKEDNLLLSIEKLTNLF